MPFDDEEIGPEVRDVPPEARADTGVSQAARDGQEKPQEQEDKEAAHERLRRKYKTASSGPLPRIDWDEIAGTATQVGDFAGKIISGIVEDTATKKGAAEVEDTATKKGAAEVAPAPASAEKSVGEDIEAKKGPTKKGEGEGEDNIKTGPSAGEDTTTRTDAGEVAPAPAPADKSVGEDSEAKKHPTKKGEGEGDDTATKKGAGEGEDAAADKRGGRIEATATSEGAGGVEVTVPKTGAGDRAAIDPIVIEKAAEGIHAACDGLGTNTDAIYAILKDKTEAERKQIDEIYAQKYGIHLEAEFKDEMSGAQLDQAINLLNRKDGSTDDAGRIHTALIERDQLVQGRSDATCEKDIRDTLSTMNSKQIEALDRDYRERYGMSLEEALVGQGNLSDGTKGAIEIYLKGADKRTDEDTLKLADLALHSQNVDMVQEAFRNASPEARQKFFAEGGEDKIMLAFLMDPEAHAHAMEFARSGELSVTTLINENQSWLGDNESAIEKALAGLDTSQRADYLRGKELAAQGIDANSLAADQRALKFYTELHDSLADAGNKSEVARWEDMIAHKDGSLVAKIAGHTGTLYSDSAADVRKEVENMSKEDWQYAKSHPEYRAEVEKALKGLGGVRVDDKDVDKIIAAYDEKMKADSYENSQSKGNRSFLEKVEDNKHWYQNDRKAILDDIAHMTPEDAQKYKDNPKFREQVDQAINDCFETGPGLEAAQHLLKRVADDGKPHELDLQEKLLMHAQDRLEGNTVKDAVEQAIAVPLAVPTMGASLALIATDTDQLQDAVLGSRAAGPVRDIVEEFRKHPEEREKILKDPELKKQFEETAKAGMTAGDYENYVKPLLETGYLSMEKQMELNTSLIDDDEQQTYKDVLALTELKGDLSAEQKDKIFNDSQSREKYLASLNDSDRKVAEQQLKERDSILNDGAYREKVFGYLSDDERQVAIFALRQGEMRPEDKIRSHVVGVGTGEEEIKEVLRDLSPAEREQLKSDYARKYGEDLTFRLLDEMGGQDAVDIKREIRREYEDSRSAYDDARDEYYQSRDGIGSAFVDQRWDGTGFQADQAYNTFSRAMTEHAAKFEELPPEERKQLMQNLQESVDMFKESKGALADGLTDAGVTVGCVAAGFVTEGGTWALLGALVVGGFFKVGAKGAIMGADYDWKSSAPIADFAAGGTDAALNMVTFGAGSSAAEAVLKQGGKALIKEGAEETLEKGLVGIVRDSIKDGTYKYSDAAVKDLVEKLAREGADKQVLEGIVRQNLDKAVKEESESTIKKLAKEYLLNVETGVVGGAGSGTVRASAQWDSEKSFGENMAAVGKAAAMSAAFGAAGAVVGTSVFKVGGKAFHGVQEHFGLKQGERLSPEQLDELARATGDKNATASYNENGDIEVTRWVERPAKPDEVITDQPTTVDRKPVADTGGDAISVAHRVETTGGADKPVPRERVSKEDLSENFPETLKKLSDEQRAALIERASRNPLFQPEAVVRFAEDAEKMMAGWEGLSKEERAAQLQTLMDDFAKERGLPTTKIEIVADEDFKAAGADYGDGTIKVKESDLKNPADRSNLIENAYHEFVHNEQDTLVIRNLADELKIDKAATPEQMGELKRLYAERTRGELTDEHLDKVLTVRDGQPLSPSDAARAGELAEAWRQYPKRSPEMQEYSESIGIVLDESKKLDPWSKGYDPNGSRDLIERLSTDDGTLAKALFGKDGTPPAVQELIDKYKTLPAEDWPKGEAETLLQDLVNERNGELIHTVTSARKETPYNLVEQEAYLIGQKARLEAGKVREQMALDAAKVQEQKARDVAKVAGPDSVGSQLHSGPRSIDEWDEPTLSDFDTLSSTSEAVVSDEPTTVSGKPVADLSPVATTGEPTIFDGAPALDIHDQPTRIEGEPLGRESMGVDIHDQPTHIEGEPLGREIIGADIHDQPTHIEGEPVTSTSEQVVSDTPASPGRTATVSDGAAPRPVEVPDDTPALVREFLERAGTPESEQGALLARIKENDLAKSEVLDGFRQQAVEMTSKWDDISQVGRNAEASRKELDDAFTRYRDLLMANAPEGARPQSVLGMHPSEARNLLRDDPDALRALDDYLRIRDTNAKITKEYYAALNPRVKEMQDLLDDLAGKQGLPRVKVEAGDKVEMGGANGFFRDGKLVLRESDFLSNQDPLTFMESAYHEFVHNQQESLVLRSLVDDEERAIRRPLTAKDMDRLEELNRKFEKTGELSDAERQERSVIGMAVEDIRKAYREQAGSGFSNDHLREILDARDGKLLTSDERVRAAELAKAWKETGPAGDAYEKAVGDLKVTNGELRKVDQSGGEYLLIERLAQDNGTLSRHLFGVDAPPREVAALVDIQKRLAAGEDLTWPASDARALLTGLLEKRQDSLVELKTQLYQKYLSGFHEQEAWVIGSTLRNDLIEAGASGRPAIAQSRGEVQAGAQAAKPTPDTFVAISGGGRVLEEPSAGKRILSIDERMPTGRESSIDTTSDRATMSGPGEAPLDIHEQPTQSLNLLTELDGAHLEAIPTQRDGAPLDIHEQPTQNLSLPTELHGAHLEAIPTRRDGALLDIHEQPTQNLSTLPTELDGAHLEAIPTQRDSAPLDIHEQPTQNLSALPTELDGAPVDIHDQSTQSLEAIPTRPDGTPLNIHDQPTQVFRDTTQVQDFSTESLDQPPIQRKNVDLEWSDRYDAIPGEGGKLANYDDGSRMKYIVDGKPYELERGGFTDLENQKLLIRAAESERIDQLEGDSFFYGKRDHIDKLGAKVHVNGANAEDLARLQEVLIPALNEDPVLQELVGAWKTQDPRFGIYPGQKRIGIGQQPEAVDQGAKAFTIYPKDAARSRELAERIDAILAEHPDLILDHPMDTGNVDMIPANSTTNRVGLVRDGFQPSVDSTPDAALFKIDGAVQEAVEAEFGGKPSNFELRKFEQNSGLRMGTLSYDSQGNLVLAGTRPERPYGDGLLYVSEASASKKSTDLTDRSALYALYQRYGLDPVDFY